MAQFSMEMPPSLSGESQDAVQLRKYVARLVDRLMYTLNNIDDENLLNNGISASKFRGGANGIAEAAAAQIGSANIGSASMQHLTVQVAEIVTAMIRTAVVDWANLKHVVGDTAIISRFVGETMFIDHLAVTSAQVVQLTVGTLCIKGSDGNYYTLDVDLDTGTVTATQTSVTIDEVIAGETTTGKHIIESDLTVEEMNASTINAVEALISRIIATRIDVDELFARQATIDKLTTGEIAAALGESLNLSSNQSIVSTVQQAVGDERDEVLRAVNTISQTATNTELRVQNLEQGLGTHIFIEDDKVRITQDQTKQWEQQLTATDLKFVNKSTQAVAASFGVSGGYADRLRSERSLSVGTEANGWVDMTATAAAVNDKWRGSTAGMPAILTEGPEDQTVAAYGDTATFTVTKEGSGTVQWQQRERGGDWADILNQTGSSLSVIATDNVLGGEFRCVADGIPSDAARVTVEGAPLIVAENQSGSTMTVTIVGTVASYDWQVRGQSAWASVSGAPQADTYTASTPGDYRLAVEDSAGRVAVSKTFTTE